MARRRGLPAGQPAGHPCTCSSSTAIRGSTPCGIWASTTSRSWTRWPTAGSTTTRIRTPSTPGRTRRCSARSPTMSVNDDPVTVAVRRQIRRLLVVPPGFVEIDPPLGFVTMGSGPHVPTGGPTDFEAQLIGQSIVGVLVPDWAWDALLAGLRRQHRRRVRGGGHHRCASGLYPRHGAPSPLPLSVGWRDLRPASMLARLRDLRPHLRGHGPHPRGVGSGHERPGRGPERANCSTRSTGSWPGTRTR